MKRLGEFAVLYLVFSAIAALCLLITTFPWHPHTVAGWALFFAAALPVTLIGEYVGTLIGERNPAAMAVERRTAGKAFSWLRIGYQLSAFLLAIAVVVVVLGLFGKWWPR